MTKLIIKGALYFDGDTVLRPHYSGNFYCVDCTEYKTEEVIVLEYDEDNQDRILNSQPIIVDGVEYYECHYSPCNTDTMELVSDLSDINYFDNEKEFKS